MTEYLKEKSGINMYNEFINIMKVKINEYENSINELEDNIKDNSIFDISLLEWIKRIIEKEYNIEYELKIVRTQNKYRYIYVDKKITEEIYYESPEFWNYVMDRNIIIVATSQNKNTTPNIVNKIAFYPGRKVEKDTIVFERPDSRTIDTNLIELLNFIDDLIIYKINTNKNLSLEEIEQLYKETKRNKKAYSIK